MLLRARKDSPADPASLETDPDRGADPLEAVLHQERAALVRRAIDGLTDDLRAAVVLRDAAGLPLRDVEQILGIGLSATKMRVARAREQLRTELEGVL